MAYLVRITPRARRDLAAHFRNIQVQHSMKARDWHQGLMEAALTLEEFPNRCAATPENPQLRHLLYGHKPHLYRVIYRVHEEQKQVNVLHVRHGARQVADTAGLE